MNYTPTLCKRAFNTALKIIYSKSMLMILLGMLSVFGYAPFHYPGLTILSMAFVYANILQASPKQALYQGFCFGIGFFGLGVSWVIVSIHDYGQLNYLLSSLITLVFIIYLSLFPACSTLVFKILELKKNPILSLFLFSAIWCLSEYVRASLFTGFPWLLIGTPLVDTPIKYLAPIVGVYGMSFIGVFLGSLLSFANDKCPKKRYISIILFIFLMLIPISLKSFYWNSVFLNNPISIGAVQANLSMRDKWDDALFWKLLKTYDDAINKLLGNQLIILPESAIPLPASYLDNYFQKLNKKVNQARSAIMLGILQPTNDNETNYYNSIITLGHAHGTRLKHQLVPFGEYIPQPLVNINHWLGLPEPNLVPGKLLPLITVGLKPIASLICYEVAYPHIVREQMPEAQWIVSISDNGWFGHSFASYQQLQMSQLLSLLTSRYQVVVNNDGLSSIIDNQGTILATLPAFKTGLLQGTLYPATGNTPWIRFGEFPLILLCVSLVLGVILYRIYNRHISIKK